MSIGKYSILVTRMATWYSKFGVAYVLASAIVQNQVLPPAVSDFFTNWILGPPKFMVVIYFAAFFVAWPYIDLRYIIVSEKKYHFSKDRNLSEMKRMLQNGGYKTLDKDKPMDGQRCIVWGGKIWVFSHYVREFNSFEGMKYSTVWMPEPRDPV